MPYLVKAHPLPLDKYGTIGGRDTESDDDYRYRIQLSLSSQTGCSEPDLRSALLQIPGLQDVVFERLSGTFHAYVYGISPDVPASLLAMVQSELDRLTAYPLTGLALAPDLVGITLATTLSLAGTVSAAAQAAAASAGFSFLTSS